MRPGTGLLYESRAFQGAHPNNTRNPFEKHLSRHHAKWPIFAPPLWQVFTPPLTRSDASQNWW